MRAYIEFDFYYDKWVGWGERQGQEIHHVS